MSLWHHVLRFFGYRQSSDERVFHFDDDLVESLRDLAAREERPTEDVAADLLATALVRRRQAEMYLQIWEGLTIREQQAVALTCLDYTNRQIGAHLRISPETAKTHVRNALLKFGVRTKAELRQELSGWDFSAWNKMKD
jgi:DNA-binding CsgD family transcriptional regulator